MDPRSGSLVTLGHAAHNSNMRDVISNGISDSRSDITPDFEFDEIDNDELVSAFVEAEGAKENKVQNVEIVYSRTGCNRWENMCSRILM